MFKLIKLCTVNRCCSLYIDNTSIKLFLNVLRPLKERLQDITFKKYLSWPTKPGVEVCRQVACSLPEDRLLCRVPVELGIAVPDGT